MTLSSTATQKFVSRGFPGGTVVENLPANAGDMGSSPGLGRSHMPWSNWAREPQLLSLRVWSLCSTTREATIVRGPRTTMKSGPRLPQLEKALAQKRRPNIAINQSINQSINLKKKKKGNLFPYLLISLLHWWFSTIWRLQNLCVRLLQISPSLDSSMFLCWDLGPGKRSSLSYFFKEFQKWVQEH